MIALLLTLLSINFPITEISFIGNKSVSGKELANEIVSKKNDEYNENNVIYDTERIKQLYRSKGFFTTEVDLQTRSIETGVEIVYTIDEGTCPRIKEVVIKGDEESKFKSLIYIKVGDFFIEKKIRMTEDSVENYYKNRGFPFAEVSSIAIPDSGILTLNVKKGDLHYIRKIDVIGLRPSKPELIYREIELKPGDLFSKSKLFRSQRKIYALGFFSTMNVELVKIEPDSIDLIFTVRELKSRILNFGIGASVPWGFLISFGLEELNLGNVGHRLKVSPSFKINIYREWETKIEGSYTVPHITPLDLTFSLLPYIWFEQDTSFSRNTRGNEFRITKIFSEHVQFNIAHKYKFIDFKPKVILPDTFKGVTNSVKFQFMFDRRDEFFNPHKGIYLVPAIEYAGGIFGGDNNFLRLEAEERYFLTFYRHTVAQRCKIGIMFPINGLGTYEKYYLGGQYSLRGYPERSLGPDAIGDERYGNILFNFNLEYRVSMPLNFGLVVFFDAGYIDNEINLEHKDFFKTTAGVGLRYYTPIGPLRLDMGFPLQEKGWEIYLGIYHIF